jgi:gliding motility-associated-like protein
MRDFCSEDQMTFFIQAIPNILTINSDGINDEINIALIPEHKNTKFKIFDRYGRKIYEQIANERLYWNGIDSGRVVNSGNYWYQLIFPDGKTENGWISVKNY